MASTDSPGQAGFLESGSNPAGSSVNPAATASTKACTSSLSDSRVAFWIRTIVHSFATALSFLIRVRRWPATKAKLTLKICIHIPDETGKVKTIRVEGWLDVETDPRAVSGHWKGNPAGPK